MKKIFICILIAVTVNVMALDFSDLTVELKNAEFSHIIYYKNYIVKFPIETPSIKIFENTNCIYEADGVYNDNFFINNYNATYVRDGNLVVFKLNTKEKFSFELYPLPTYYVKMVSSKTDNLFYAASYGGDILKFNNGEECYQIAYVEIVGNVIKVYKYMPEK